MDKNNDQWLKELASRYVDIDGENLKNEMKDLEYDTDNLDKKVSKAIKPNKKKRYFMGLGIAAAACLGLMIRLADFSDNSSDSNQGIDIVQYDREDSPDEEYEVLQLNAELPDEFSISNVEQDKGQTIYYIENEKLDHVVLTLEETDLDGEYRELMEIPIDGKVAYGMVYSDYSVLAFEKDGITYIMTCKFELDTLVLLGAEII